MSVCPKDIAIKPQNSHFGTNFSDMSACTRRLTSMSSNKSLYGDKHSVSLATRDRFFIPDIPRIVAISVLYGGYFCECLRGPETYLGHSYHIFFYRFWFSMTSGCQIMNKIILLYFKANPLNSLTLRGVGGQFL